LRGESTLIRGPRFAARDVGGEVRIFVQQPRPSRPEQHAHHQQVKGSGVKYAMRRYPGTQHGFNNDTTPRFDPVAAREAWGTMLALFERNLR
jgi:dienelactone hydrolase